MDIPSWTPDPVRTALEQMHTNPACAGRRRAVFDRLLENSKMKAVYGVLLQRDRKTGNFRYPAKGRSNNQSAAAAQISAIREVLQLTVSAASDRISVTKLEEIAEASERWSAHVALLRVIAHDMALAVEWEMLGLNDPQVPALPIADIQALDRVANWIEHLQSKLRLPDDPLIVDKDRGDPIVRGVQIVIAVKLEEQFGNRLDGTAATLTSVALDVETSPRVSRSALT
jgi:hypothetical protein